jgi:hypothetical protein
MKSIHLPVIALFALGSMIALDSQAAGVATRVPSERSRAMPTATPLHWRSEAFPADQVSRLHYPEIAAERILKVQQYNATRRMKPAQSGIARSASNEGAARTLPPLRWVRLADGGSVSRIELASPVAMGLRVGLQVQALDARAELRFAGSSRPSNVVAMMTGKDIMGLADSRGVFWTPGTDGEKQFIEIYLQPGIPSAGVRLQAPLLSHLLVNGLDDARIMEKAGFGQSGTCNVNTVCRVAELGMPYVSAKNAVAHMSYTYPNGSSFICSGTLLADTVAGTQVPYFYTAHHCFAGDVSGVPATSYPSGFQAVANTLNTYWKYETTACTTGVNPGSTLLAGGSDYLYSDPDTDGMLLRLKNTPPAGSEFSGWDYALLPASSLVVGIHHPNGDAKKVSSGQQLARDANQNEVAWLSGTTEGGSSGSGLFTADATGYHLRGGLLGGSASCANTGSLANAGNRDYYSRFDVVFAHISQYLAPATATPQRMNGSQPLIPPRPAAVTQAAPATLPRKVDRRRAPMGPFEP